VGVQIVREGAKEGESQLGRSASRTRTACVRDVRTFFTSQVILRVFRFKPRLIGTGAAARPDALIT
jgi:hypothetical protein